MHPNYDEGQRLPMKGGQRRTSRLAKNLAEIGEMALLRMLASAEMRISQRIVDHPKADPRSSDYSCLVAKERVMPIRPYAVKSRVVEATGSSPGIL